MDALKERDINPGAQRYLSKVHAWIAIRRDLSLPAVINPHLNDYYKLYNRGVPDTSEQDLQSSTPSETRIQTRRDELIQTWVFNPEIEDSEIESEEDHYTTDTDSDVDLKAILSLREGSQVDLQNTLMKVQEIQEKVKWVTRSGSKLKGNNTVYLKHLRLLQRLLRAEVKTVKNRYWKANSIRQELQWTPITPGRLLSENELDKEEEGRSLSGLVESLTPTATSSLIEQTGDTIMTKSNTNKQKRKTSSGETSPSFPPPKTYQFVTPDKTQETNNTTKGTKKGTIAEETEKSTTVPKINSNSVVSSQAGQTAKVNRQNLKTLETLRNVTKTVTKLKLKAKTQAKELNATHEERFRNKKVRGKVNVTKDPCQYEKENSGVVTRSKEKAGKENKPIDISDSTLGQRVI